MTTWHIYSLETGIFTGQSVTGDDATLAANVPDGCGGAADVIDWASQRVDLATGAVIDWQPPAPADDAMRTWAWHAGAKRWIDQPTLAARRAQRMQEVQLAIQTQEAAQARPMRELLQALLNSHAPDQQPRARMQHIADEIARLQALRAALAAAQTQTALDQIPTP